MTTHWAARGGGRWLACLLGAALLFGFGCEEEKDCPACPSPAIRIDYIQAVPESTSVGDSLHLWGIGQGGGLSFEWQASHGRFIETDGNYARWKAPDAPAIVTIRLLAFNDTESATTTLTVPVEMYVPRVTPAYAGASFCGLECHGVAGHGSRYDTWIQTAHATAYEGVSSSADFAPTCLACHTVGAGDINAQGHPLHNGGYDEAPVERLAGVQCESCHGPLANALGDTIADHGALATGDFLLEIGTAADPTGCGRCHEAPVHGHTLVTDWAGSRHAFAHQADGVAGDPACAACHTASGFVESFATGAPPAQAPDAPLPITCAVCHDPHSGAQAGDLRVGASRDDDICRRCHTDAGATTPHAPQAQMFAGEGGREFDLSDPPSSPHIRISEKGCVACHYPDHEGQRPHRFLRDLESCAACHPDAQSTTLGWSQGRAEIMALTTALAGELAAATPADSLTDAFKDADYNLQFVRADGSNGVHNYLYAKALIEASLAEFEPGR